MFLCSQLLINHQHIWQVTWLLILSLLPWLQVYGKYKKTDQAYLRHLHGSSWHGNDAK
jgi:hypothetical protein